jgi:hypothetical protein
VVLMHIILMVAFTWSAVTDASIPLSLLLTFLNSEFYTLASVTFGFVLVRVRVYFVGMRFSLFLFPFYQKSWAPGLAIPSSSLFELVELD